MQAETVVENPMREGMRLERTAEPCTVVIFGASGDLTHRKLVPALWSLYAARTLPEHSAKATRAIAAALSKWIMAISSSPN